MAICGTRPSWDCGTIRKHEMSLATKRKSEYRRTARAFLWEGPHRFTGSPFVSVPTSTSSVLAIGAEGFERGVSLAALDSTYVAAVHLCFVGKVLLREALGFPGLSSLFAQQAQ